MVSDFESWHQALAFLTRQDGAGFDIHPAPAKRSRLGIMSFFNNPFFSFCSVRDHILGAHGKQDDSAYVNLLAEHARQTEEINSLRRELAVGLVW